MAYSSLSVLPSHTPVVTATPILSAEENSQRNTENSFANTLRVEGIAVESHRASTTEPTDKIEGTIWCDTNTDPALMKYYKDGAGNLETLVGATLTQTLSNKTLPTPAISNPAFSGTSTGPITIATCTLPNPSITSPSLSGTAVGTYTLGGTPTITSPTINTPAISSPTVTGVIDNADGTVSLPSYSFSADLNTGIMRNFPDNVGFACGGALVGNFTPSGLEIQAGGGIRTNSGGVNEYTAETILEIGDWNMDTTGTVNKAHGLTLAKIRGITALIRNDANTTYVDLASSSSVNTTPLIQVDATNVNLTREFASLFDGTAYDSTSFNRGWIYIKHVI